MNTETNPFVSDCDLCLVGGGYAAVNALNSATYHLKKGSRVIVIAKEHGWGGNWINQYNYVRLHQPYQRFTAGKREWDLLKPDTYLADKREVLRHLEDIVYKCVEEKKLDLVVFFNYLQYGEIEVLQTVDTMGKKQVKLKARQLINGKHNYIEDLPQFLEIHADRVIKGTGFNIIPNEPLNSILTPLSSKGNNNIQSISPSDVLTPEWNVKMRFKANGANVIPAPIYVIGSGKTAMDVIYHLSKKLKGMKDRIRCISGRGTWFSWVKKGFLHTPIPGAASFALGICSTEEINYIKKVLQPSNEKIIRAHLLGLVDNVKTKRTQLKLQTIETKEIFYKDLESDSIIVNCTSHIPNNLKHEPILSHEGMVCSPQYICGFKVNHGLIQKQITMDTEILPFGLAFENQHQSGPVALLSFYEQQNFVDDLGRPAYIKAITETSLQAVKAVGGIRFYGGTFDTNAVVGEDVVLDEVPNKAKAYILLKSLEQLAFSGAVGKLTVLAMRPVRLPFQIRLNVGLSPLSRFLSTIAPISDKKWDKRREEEFTSSRILETNQIKQLITNIYNEDLTEKEMFMLNLNKFKKIATYAPGTKEASEESEPGIEAYNRYGSPLDLLRRGAYPYYIGINCKTVLTTEKDTLEGQDWDQLILVYYPYRNKIIEMITSQSYAARLYHRTAALERAVAKPTLPWWNTPSDDIEMLSKM
eukprot:g9631.t1